MALKNKKKPTINIYTDGACKGNPGPGGWGAILIYNKHEKKINGFSPQTTNNIMELTAVIEALKILKEKCNVKITTDSKYVKLGITEWIYNWKKNGWRNAQKKPLKNKSLWEMLDQLQKLLDLNGEHGLFIAKKHMKCTCNGFKGANDLQHSLVRAKTSVEAMTLLHNQLLLMS